MKLITCYLIVSFSYLTCISQSAPLAQVYIFTPKGGSQNLHLFFGKKLIHDLKNGERLIYNVNVEGLLKVTVLQNTYFAEPPSLSKNTRSVLIKKGKSYYFEIGSTGEVTYLVDPEKGRKKFNDDKTFSATPIQISISIPDSILVRG